MHAEFLLHHSFGTFLFTLVSCRSAALAILLLTAPAAAADSAALHIINEALHYRNLTPPKPDTPLTVPFLAHEDFTKHCQQWLRATIQQHKHLAIPLHLPTHRMREAAHKTLRAQLHNHRAWEDTLHTPPDSSDLPCACSHLRTLLLEPNTPTTNSHYILTLDADTATTSPHLPRCQYEQHLLPKQSPLLPYFPNSLHKMAPTSRTPHIAHPTLGPFPPTPMATSSNIHGSQLAFSDSFKSTWVTTSCSTMPITNSSSSECSALANTSQERSTHGKPQNFSNHYHTLHQPTSTTTSRPPYISLRSRCKWGFRKDFTIPYGIVHLKAKKQWQKGRTIISYFHSLSGNLLRITSRALDIILQHLFPQHPGQLSIPQLWRHFHCYLTQTPTDVALHATNDDLVGFFNSVPQHRLIDAVHSMIQQRQTQQSTHTLTVDAKATGNLLAGTTQNIPHNAPSTRPTSLPLSPLQ